MSDSDENSAEVTTNSESVVNKKKKFMRERGTLKVNITDEELSFREKYKTCDILQKFPELVKCTVCFTSLKTFLEGKDLYSHPSLEVLMCERCISYYGDGEFSLDDDNEDKYCRWCGEGGKLFICSQCICGFCPKCIRRHFGLSTVKNIKNDDDWVCFICSPKPLWKLRAICHYLIEQSQNIKKKESITSDQIKQNDKQCTAHSGIQRSASDNGNGKICSSNSTEDEFKCRTNIFPEKRKRRSGRVSRGENIKKFRRIVEGKFKNTIPPKKLISSTTAESDSSSEEETIEERVLSQSESNNSAGKKWCKKLKDVLAIVEATSERCLQVCQSKINKLQKRDNMVTSREKLLTECEDIKSMIIVFSSSLSTAYNLTIAIEQKYGIENCRECLVSGRDSSPLMKAIGEILLHKNVKSSYLVRLVHDILMRYPHAQLASNNFEVNFRNMLPCMTFSCNDHLSVDKKSFHEYLLYIRNHAPGNDEESSVEDRRKKNVNHFSGFPPMSSQNSNCEISYPDNDLSTDIFDDDNKLLNDTHVIVNSNLDTSSKANGKGAARSFALSDDLNNIRAEASKIREQILNSSSNSSNCDNELFHKDSSDSSKDYSVRFGDADQIRKMECSQAEHEWKQKKKHAIDSEEKILKRLLNLSSLDKNVASCSLRQKNYSYNAKKNSPLRLENNSGEASNESCSSSETYHSLCGDPCYGKNVDDKRQWSKDNASMLKDYILETTSSDMGNITSNDEDHEKKHSINALSSEKQKSPAGESKKSYTDVRMRSGSTSDVNSNENNFLVSKVEEKKGNRNKSENEVYCSSSSFGKYARRRKKNAIIITTDTDTEYSVGSAEEYMPGTTNKETGGRRNIRKILSKGSLHLETKQAIKMENERKKRIAERNDIYYKSFPNAEESGRLVLDFDLETKEVLVEVPKELAKKLKPHQKKGIKFMWDCCFESVENLEQSNGTGCILAHCMGLGKTFQIIALVFTVLKYEVGVNTVLIVCPLNVVDNWLYEFDLWLKDSRPKIDVSTLNHYKKTYERLFKAKQWHTDGGVMVISYDMIRNLTGSSRKIRREGRKADFSKFLLDPGPDLVICDEGHLLKNEDTALSRCMSKMMTSRRIVLTGTPLQNNLLEYHSMIQFIKPNILGTRKEFMNRFGNPIMNGQFEDSTESDVKFMRARSHVLHKLLDGCIQRFDYSVLTPFLPEKQEYVISIRLTDTQALLYGHYVGEFGTNSNKVTNKAAKLFSDFNWLQKIWTHPATIASHASKHDDCDDELSSSEESVICVSEGNGNSKEEPKKLFWKDIIKPEEYEDIRSSGKLIILFDILKHCREIGDKVLVFSQSLYTLDLIEYFLKKINSAYVSKTGDIPLQYRDSWVPGVDYFRMDGSTKVESRSRWCKTFNKSGNKRSRLFLISTRAGGLGINLVAANRVIVFDVSWNPSHDVQSIFRVYRFGQNKTCYIYRFFAEATMEEKIYERQVTKLSMEKRVLDEYQIQRHYAMGNLRELYKYEPLPKDKWTVPKIPKDMLLAEILKAHRDIIVNYHEHDSLLENKEEEELTEEERKAAWEDFEKERLLQETRLDDVQTLPASSSSMTRKHPSVFRVPNPWFSIAHHNRSGQVPLKVSNVGSLRSFYTHGSILFDNGQKSLISQPKAN